MTGDTGDLRVSTEGTLVSLFLVERTWVLFIFVSSAMLCKTVGTQNMRHM